VADHRANSSIFDSIIRFRIKEWELVGGLFEIVASRQSLVISLNEKSI
jgi:hypothetical protein